MRPLRWCLPLYAAALATLGCPKAPEPATDAGVAAEVDAGPPPVSFALRYQAADASMESIPLAGPEAARPLIPATTALELRSTLPLNNYRVRLFDEADRALVSDDMAEESESGLLYRIALPEPLKTGYKYTLVVEALTGNAMSDAAGRELEDVRIPFQVAGEKEKPAPPVTKSKKRRR